MKTISDFAFELVRELYDNPDIIPSYNEELIKKCAEQINELYQANLKLLLERNSHGIDSSSSEAFSSPDHAQQVIMLRAQQLAIERIKRCCCAYLHERMQRLKKLRWKWGGILPNSVKSNLSEEEIKWWNAYRELIDDFQMGFGKGAGLNLFNHIRPPKTLLIYVRSLKDFGEFETSDGTRVVFTKDSLHFLPQHDCENLIRQGILEHAH